MAKVPLIETQMLSEWGDLSLQAGFVDPSGMDRDYTYVPGFSEMRRTHEIKKGEWIRGDCPKSEIPTLPVNLRWARCQNKAGEPDNVKTFAHGRQGYRLATAEDIGTEWLKELPGTAHIGADKSIRNGDTVLMVCDAQRAAQNRLQKDLATERRLQGASGSFAQEIEKAKAQHPGLNTRGLQPSIEVLPQSEREASLPAQPVSVKRTDTPSASARPK